MSDPAKRHNSPANVTADATDSLFAALDVSTYTAIDVETTGLDAKSDSLIELGAVRFENGVVRSEFSALLSCERSLDPFITELTGITDEQLQGQPSFAEVADDFREFLADSVIIGQNIDFDLKFLSAAGKKLVDSPPRNRFGFHGARVLDTAMLARIFWPEFTKFSLHSLTVEFGVSLTQAHRAAADARATGEVLAAMIHMLSERVWRNLADELADQISTTTHRSRFFFQSLSRFARTLDQPAVVDSIPRAAESTDSLPQIEKWLGEDGILEKSSSVFSFRPIQLQMAEHIETALHDNKIAVVEAPTGTGKSLGYLLPALIWAAEKPEEARQVIVSSHTKALQEQLFGKEIGNIEQAGGVSVKAAVLKGRRNYLCKRRLRLLMRDAAQRLSDFERIRLMSLLRWSELTTTGDISEIGGFNEQADPYLWSLVCSDSQACAGSACGSSKGDYHRRAQETAAQARLVFVNHALLMRDSKRFLQSPSPNCKLIIDEAHALERAVISAMTIELSHARFRDALTRVADERSSRGILNRILRSAKNSESALEQRLSALIDAAVSLHSTVRQVFASLAEAMLSAATDPRRSLRIRFRHNDHLHRTVQREFGDLHLLWNEFAAEMEDMLREQSGLTGENRLAPEVLSELRSTLETVQEMASNLETLLVAEDDNRVFWLEAGRGRTSAWCSLYAAPISISELLHAEFWSKIDSAILTSATLTANGGFQHLRGALGLDLLEDGRLTELALPSPFNLSEQMRIFVPDFLPDPRDQGSYIPAVAELCCDIVGNVPRGTLILCTSLEAVRLIGAALEPVARKTGRALFSQRSAGSPHELLRQFRKHSNAILVGAASFWEGVDVIGESLQILIVAKLPFDVPTDPWVDAYSEHLRNSGRDAFNEFSLPTATLRLKQGIGRLIRHQNDQGVAVIADPRLHRSRFGKRIQESLPLPASAVSSASDLKQNILHFFAQPGNP